MNVTLTDRYVSAALRTVPEAQRADIAAELRASIADQVDARRAAGEPVEEAERAVLTDLGDPERLAAGYTDRPLFLIGPRYFLEWKRLLVLLLWIVPPCAAFGVALGQVLSGAHLGTVIGTTFAITISVIAHVAFWVTLVFALIERYESRGGRHALAPWTLDRLPEKRATGATLGDLIGTLVWLALVVGAVLWDRFLGLAYVGKKWMPFLAEGLWPWWMTGFFVLISLAALLAVAVYAHGSWTYTTATVRAVLNAAIVGPLVYLLVTGRLVDPAVVKALTQAFGSDENVVRILAALIAVTTVGIAVWDAIDGFLKARRSRLTA